jgi:hypothetical protein
MGRLGGAADMVSVLAFSVVLAASGDSPAPLRHRGRWHGTTTGTAGPQRWQERSGSLVAADHGGKDIWAAQAIDSKRDVYFGTRGKHIYGFGSTARTLRRHRFGSH